MGVTYQNAELARVPWAWERGGKLWLFFPILPQVAQIRGEA